MNWDFLFSVTAEKNMESFAAEGGLLPEYKAIVAELVRLNLYSNTKVAQLGEKSDGVFVVNKHCRETFRVESARLREVIAQIQTLPKGSTWDDIRPIVDPPEPLQTLVDFQRQLESFGLSGLSFSCEEGEGRVVYRAFSSQGESARCVCDRDQWGYWSYQLELFVKKIYQASTIEGALEDCPELMYREVIGFD